MIRTTMLLLLLFLTGCATTLTDAGRKVKILDSGSVAECVRIGLVTGESPSLLSGGDYGVIYATNDARNRAARIPEADTLVITQNERKTFGGEISGIAYNCNPQRNKPLPKAPPTAAPKDEIFDKAKKCQAKGGVWVNDQCVIPIE